LSQLDRSIAQAQEELGIQMDYLSHDPILSHEIDHAILHSKHDLFGCKALSMIVDHQLDKFIFELNLVGLDNLMDY